MKKIILLLAAVLCFVSGAAAQDLIVKKDAVQIEARVTEITPEVVRYKRFTNPDGPTYVLPVAELSYIRYANGETEYFDRAAAQSHETPAAAEPATSVSASDAERPAPRYVAERFKIGDYYDRDGVQGIVCQVTDDGEHGLVLSLDEVMIDWSKFRKPDLRTVGADDNKDGARNMEIVARYIADNGLSWSDFPAFEWCRAKGEGWYLPSIDEVLTIGNNYNGGTRVRNTRAARNEFNTALKERGGKRMDRMVYYFSSTEKDEKSAFTSHMIVEPPYVLDIPKYNKFLVRAVHKF